MKKNGKILIMILCLIILCLIIFIVVDKVMIKKSEENKLNEENSISNRIDNSVNSENENNVAKSDNSQKQNNISSLNGTYERPDESKNTDNTKNQNQIKIANEAIRKALKDKNWITKNIVGTEWKSEDEEFWKRIYDDAEFTFAKLNNDKNTPKYIVNLDSYSFILITYEDEKVITSHSSVEGCQIQLDINNEIIIAYPDSYDSEAEFYGINNGNFYSILNWKEKDNSPSERSYYYSGVECSYEEYKKFTKEYMDKCNFVSIETKLTDENIDKYIR